MTKNPAMSAKVQAVKVRSRAMMARSGKHHGKHPQEPEQKEQLENQC
jgi:hypothetical protein